MSNRTGEGGSELVGKQMEVRGQTEHTNTVFITHFALIRFNLPSVNATQNSSSSYVSVE